VAAVGALPLTDVRAVLATLLAPQADDDPEVLGDIPDAVSPPVLLLEWGDPWLEPRTLAPGYWDAHLNVLCLASRVEPGPGIATLESLVGYAVARLEADARSWPVESSTAPRVFLFAGVNYLGARLFLRVPVSIETEA
jgi:hypothetical protein